MADAKDTSEVSGPNVGEKRSHSLGPGSSGDAPVQATPQQPRASGSGQEAANAVVGMGTAGEEQRRNEEAALLQEAVVTMGDVLHDWAELEEEAEEQSRGGWGDESRCTYLVGGGKETERRFLQPMYACYDCMEKSGRVFAFCYGCSMNCHLDHRLEEVFEKRAMRCDCGTSPLVATTGKCKLMDKSLLPVNLRNVYGQNYKGLYCFCRRAYDPATDEMLQCTVCQDWFHLACIAAHKSDASIPTALALSDDTAEERPKARATEAKEEEGKAVVPPSDSFESFVCSPCMKTRPVLSRYRHECVTFSGVRQEMRHGAASREEAADGHFFAREGWRTRLCRCDPCLEAYTDAGVVFLAETDIRAADVVGGSKAEAAPKGSLMQQGMQALTDAVPSATKRIELARGFQHFASTLHGILKPIAEAGEVVTTEHIATFVEELKSSKREARSE